ncbi:globin domain-containing protein [uncultured Pseudoteredinibacter sp.]|uniref:globin domain-containing protein n=1 Tax=uncultured Pseudoteredinibacter sp. TaxID=1641701 RepID=UPI00261FA5B5|nr:globin domain-containing protein [uncultured Pseudoteredinibacter sp.]
MPLMVDASYDETPKSRFLASLERCSAQDEFVPSFYRRFMSASPDIERRFRYTSFEKQNRMLLRSLQLSAHAIDGDPEALAELKLRSETHDRHHLNIKPELYNLWLDSLVLSAAEFDEHWSAEVDEAWRTVLGFVIRRMISSY